MVLLIFFKFAMSSFAQLDPGTAVLLQNNSPMAEPAANPAVNSAELKRYSSKPRSEKAREPAEEVAPRAIARQVEGPRQPEAPGETKADMPAYSTALSSDDKKDFRILELSLAPMYFYQDAQSDFWHRRYSTSGPGVYADIRVWFSENFGLSGNFRSSILSSVNDSASSSSRVPATSQWLQAGFRVRSQRMLYGVDYYEYQFRTGSEAAQRQRLKTYAPALVLEISGEKKESHWFAGTLFAPKAFHTEEPTAGGVRSGDSSEGIVVGLNLGHRYLIDEQNAVFWQLGTTIERNQFSGQTTGSDPVAGSSPRNVSVTNVITSFEFGLRWGR